MPIAACASIRTLINQVKRIKMHSMELTKTPPGHIAYFCFIFK
jgi:hypothetical protein